ncbi:pilus assembly protein TadG-related protein [Bradyrhizobium tunisiense]|uniref:pilus assembly protein TadG-related protein n=1 Tax=Bradyrhizobium tunisiense TaxID=3278709 RepID=UPI0035D98B17
MRCIFRNRRGSVAFATVVALVPLVGVVALGAEAGSWYVTRQHAQNAADGAAYSGGLTLACILANGTGVTCNDPNGVDYRAKQVAAQNAFCNSGDNGYPGSKCAGSLPSGISRTVQIASLTSWNGNSGNFVQATVSQQQPAYLAKILGLSTVDIAATAVAQVELLKQPPCVLALKDSVTFQGSPTVSSSSCGISSNSSAADAIGFKGNNGINLDAPSFTVGGCSQTGGSQCDKVQTYSKFIPDPLSSVNAAIAALKPADFPDGACVPPAASTPSPISLPAYGSPKKCYYNSYSFQNNKTYHLKGTYFFANGTLSIQGNNTIQLPCAPSSACGATLIFLPPKFVSSSDLGGKLSIGGNPTIQLAGQKTPLLPAALSSVSGLMTDLLIYDPEITSGSVKVTGSSTSYFDGIVYVPNSVVTYSGNASGAPTSGCYQIIAFGVTFAGDTKLDNSGCSNSATKPNVQTVLLVH